MAGNSHAANGTDRDGDVRMRSPIECGLFHVLKVFFTLTSSDISSKSGILIHVRWEIYVVVLASLVMMSPSGFFF
jgi:hypothetical protein